jgi:hypothetical protein
MQSPKMLRKRSNVIISSCARMTKREITGAFPNEVNWLQEYGRRPGGGIRSGFARSVSEGLAGPLPAASVPMGMDLALDLSFFFGGEALWNLVQPPHF